MTKTQAATLDRIVELATSGRLDVTYGGIKGVNRASLFALESKGMVAIERVYEGEGVYARLVKMIVIVA